MSATFSGVVRKPGTKFAPRAAPRRNAPRGVHASAAARPAEPPETSTASPAPAPLTQENGIDTVSAASLAAPTDIQSIYDVERSTPTPPSANDTPHSLDAQAAVPSVDVPSLLTSQGSVALSPSATGNEDQGGAELNEGNFSKVSATDRQTRDGQVPKSLKRKANQMEPSEKQPSQPVRPTTRAKTRPTRKTRGEGAVLDNGSTTHVASPLSLQGASASSKLTPPASHFPLTPRQSSSPAVDLLENATRQAARVSSLANAINEETRVPQLVQSASESVPGEQAENQARAHERPVRPDQSRNSRSRRAQEMEALAAAVVDAAGGGEGGGRRALTPEDAESHVIEPSEVTMGDLTADNRLGKKSQTEKKMQENWPEIRKRRKEQLERARELAQNGRYGRLNKDRGKVDPEDSANGQAVVPAIVPVQTIVNGQIVVQHESREIDPTAHLQQQVLDHHESVREIDRIYKHVNQSTLNPRMGGGRGKSWDDESTELFYKGIRMFGTDFLMIANLFPNMTRSQVKNKYNREERSNYERLLEALSNREDIDLDEYGKMTDKQWEDPQKIQEELEAEEKRLREEDEKRRAEEGFVNPDADVALPSREQGSIEPEQAENRVDAWLNETQPSPEVPSSRMDSLAASVIQAAVQPKKRQTRKSKEPGKRKEPKKAKRPLEGVEERLGTIDEVDA